MKVKLAGLVVDKTPSGATRYRVRKEGDKTKRTTMPVGPTHPDFLHHYYAARAGGEWKPTEQAPEVVRSIDWLVKRYLKFVEDMVAAGQMSADTLKQRRSVLARMCDYRGDDGVRYGDCDMDAPTSAFVEIRDAWASRPGAADNLIKSIKALYTWAMERDEIGQNPAAGIGAINKKPKGGAKPWTPADIIAFKEAHPKGTTAHLWLTVQAFTACRIGDALWIGRGQEKTRNGQLWLEFQPRKKGSAFVSIPMLPPLIEATRLSTVIGPSYILNEKGLPFSSVEALRVRVQRWCKAAGLDGRSSHGVRKAVAELMAEAGSTQHQMMSVMSHKEARTSEVYTKGVERRGLAADGLKSLAALDW